MVNFQIPKLERITDVKRDGVSTLAQISAFLGALLFSAFVLLVQQKTDYQKVIVSLPPLQITNFHFFAIPLVISIILFILAAIFFSYACCEVGEKCYKKAVGESFIVFILGTLLFFFSFIAFLLFVDLLVGIVGALVLIAVVLWFNSKY